MDKPIIRHCYNCKYKCDWVFRKYCEVRYNFIDFPRLRALTCRFYKQKEMKYLQEKLKEGWVVATCNPIGNDLEYILQKEVKDND